MSVLKKIIFVLSLLTTSTFLPATVEASLEVSPPVFDDTGLPGDTISGTLSVSNSSKRRLNVFISVRNVSKGEDGGIDDDLQIKRGLESAESLADWVSITRAPLELEAGETEEVPIKVKIDPRAEEGTYHAYVFFGEGTRRGDAENDISRDRATLLSINVGDDSKDNLQLVEFSSEGNYVSGPPVTFNVELENRGDTTLTPSGEIIIYNRNGREVGSTPFNEDGRALEPEETGMFDVVWEKDLDWGKQRARLSLSYGAANTGPAINDTLFFTVLPIIPLLLIFFVFLFLIIFFIHYTHKKQEMAYNNIKRKRGRFHEEEADENTIDLR